MQLISTPAKLTARAAQRLQACIHAVELALRELDHIGFSFESGTPPECTAAPIYGYNLPYHEDALQEH